MNTEATQEKSNVDSTGERLRIAREKMGLTQQSIADRLCLKLSTVRDLEEDRTPTDLASTFLRGYIRSYARLVHIPEEELLPMMAKQAPVRAAKVEPMQSFALGKRRKKRDGWLMIFTWLVVFVVVGLTGAWWWQNHKAAQDELVSLSGQVSMVSGDSNRVVPLDGGSIAASQNESGVEHTLVPAVPATPLPSAATATAPSVTTQVNPSVSVGTEAQPAVVAPSQASVDLVPNQTSTDAATGQLPVGHEATAHSSTLPTSSADMSLPTGDPSALVMHFTDDCWLEVTDAAGKKLFSGIQRSGGKLSLAGTAPYRLKIGAPAAVQIQYQGNPVDLSRFIRSNQVARLTVGAP